MPDADRKEIGSAPRIARTVENEETVLRLQWSKIKFQFRGMWVVYSVNSDGCQSICRGSFEQKLWS
jgi:hypothetical protein